MTVNVLLLITASNWQTFTVIIIALLAATMSLKWLWHTASLTLFVVYKLEA